MCATCDKKCPKVRRMRYRMDPLVEQDLLILQRFHSLFIRRVQRILWFLLDISRGATPFVESRIPSKFTFVCFVYFVVSLPGARCARPQPPHTLAGTSCLYLNHAGRLPKSFRGFRVFRGSSRPTDLSRRLRLDVKRIWL